MSVLDFLKPAPHIKEITDPQVIKKKYSYWRIRTFYSMYIGYAFYYFTRKSFTFAMPAMMNELNLSKSQLGMLGSILALTYGASKFFSGIMSDRSNPRYFMSVGLILTGLFNIFFGLSSGLMAFAVFWGLNGWFQGWGWPPCTKLLTHWYSQSERGSWWSLLNTSHNVGGALIPFVAAFLAEHYGWRYAMFGPGIICIFIGLILLNRLRDVPRSLGLPSIETYKNDFPDQHHEKQRLELSIKEILFKYVLKNKYIWILAFSYFLIYVIRQGVNDWTSLFLIESKGYSYIAAGSCIFWFEAGGFIGSLIAGFSSDFLFKGRRGPVNIIYTLLALGTIYLMWKTPGGSLILDSIFVFFIGFFIFGPQMLIGVVAAELVHKKAAGTANGFVGWWGYIGAAFAGGPLGFMIKTFGWGGYFVVLVICAILALLVLLPLAKVKANPDIN